MRYCFAILFTFSLYAQRAPTPATAEKSADQAGKEAVKEKPDPRKKARELLDGAAEMLDAVQPQVQVVALMHLAENYQVFDRAKALDYLKQAFAGAAVLPAEDAFGGRANLQARIVAQVADMNLPAAVEMLKEITLTGKGVDPRTQAINKIVNAMVQKEQYDEALALIENVGSTGDYPFGALSALMGKLAPDDPRQVTAFGGAMVAFASRPNQTFGQLVARRWRNVPPQMAQSAVGDLVNWILNRKDDYFTSQTISSAKGAVSLNSPAEADLFDVMYVLRAVDPKRAGEVLERFPALRQALKLFPEGSESLRDPSGGMSMSTNSSVNPISGDQQARQQLDAIANNRAAAALAAASQDARKALDLVKTIPAPDRQAEVLGRIAQGVSEKDPDAARQVLARCVSILDDIKDPSLRAANWDIVAEAAHRIENDKLAWEAIDKGMSDSAALYKSDADEDSPNQALRDYWPSTQSYRRMVAEAAKIFGVDAEPLLSRIGDPELALLARIEMAQVLLGRPRSSNMTAVSHGKE